MCNKLKDSNMPLQVYHDMNGWIKSAGCPQVTVSINPLVTNGLSYLYHSDESTFIFRGIRINFSFLFHFFNMKIMQSNRIAPDGTSRFAASLVGPICLRYVPKKGRQAYVG